MNKNQCTLMQSGTQSVFDLASCPEPRTVDVFIVAALRSLTGTRTTLQYAIQTRRLPRQEGERERSSFFPSSTFVCKVTWLDLLPPSLPSFFPELRIPCAFLPPSFLRPCLVLHDFLLLPLGPAHMTSAMKEGKGQPNSPCLLGK